MPETETTTSTVAEDLIGYESHIELDSIFPSDLNPRKVFDPEALQQLATSLQQHGQLQNLVVRAISTGGYELIGGERRYRAAQLAGLSTLRCRVLRCDDATAIELRGVENYRRQQLNAIEEAIWFQQMLDTGKYNQTTLADHLGISPGQVSNRLRLLRLPQEWQDRIMSGELPATHARVLIPWADRPTVLAALDTDLGERSVNEVESHVAFTVRRVTKPLDSGWDGPRFDVTPERIAELDVVELPAQYGTGTTRRAFNVARWEEMQAAAIEELHRQDEARRAEGTAEAGEDDDEDAERPEDESELSWHLIDRQWRIHLSQVMAGHLATSKGTDLALRVFVAGAVQSSVEDVDLWLAEKSGELTDKEIERSSSLQIVWHSTSRAKSLPSLLKEWLIERLSDSEIAEWATPLPLSALRMILDDLGVDYRANWIPSRTLLEACSTVQLRELFTDGMAKPAQVRKWSRDRLLKELEANWPAGYVPVLLESKVLTAQPVAAESDGDDEDE